MILSLLAKYLRIIQMEMLFKRQVLEGLAFFFFFFNDIAH